MLNTIANCIDCQKRIITIHPPYKHSYMAMKVGGDVEDKDGPNDHDALIEGYIHSQELGSTFTAEDGGKIVIPSGPIYPSYHLSQNEYNQYLSSLKKIRLFGWKSLFVYVFSMAAAVSATRLPMLWSVGFFTVFFAAIAIYIVSKQGKSIEAFRARFPDAPTAQVPFRARMRRFFLFVGASPTTGNYKFAIFGVFLGLMLFTPVITEIIWGVPDKLDAKNMIVGFVIGLPMATAGISILGTRYIFKRRYGIALTIEALTKLISEERIHVPKQKPRT